MAEGLNVSRGINQGAAQIYNSTQNAVNTYARTVVQQQAKREAEQKALADKLSQFNTEGLREVDKDGFYQVYDGWKNKTYEAMKAKDPKERFRLQAEAEKERQKAQKYVFDSKAKTQRDLAVGTKVLGKPHFFSEQGKQLYNKSLSAPIYSKDDIVDYSTIPLGYDKSKVVSEINKLNEELLKFGKYDEVEGVTKKAGDLTVAEFAKIKRVPQEAQIRAYEMLYRGNDGFKAILEESYPQLDWDNNEGQSMQMALTDMVTNAPLVKDEGSKSYVVPNRDMTDYQKRMLSLAERRLAKSESEDDSSIGEVEVDKKFYGNAVIRADGSDADRPVQTIKFDYFIKPTEKNFISTQLNNVLNLRTGRNEQMGAGGQVSLAGLGLTKTKGGKQELKALVLNNGVEYVVNESDLPIKVKTDEGFKAAKAKVLSQANKPATSQPQKTTQPTSGKKTIKGF